MLNPATAKEILIGFSGGADSTALLLYLAELYPEKIEAVHFNHQIRKESDREERWCKEFCRQRAVRFHSYKLDVLNRKKRNEAVEEAARRLRTEKWQLLAGQKSIIALAHHKDDINENFFIRLMRGSGLRGLTGLKPFTEIGSLTFWRPLLDKSKNELIEFLKEKDVTNWCEDESNKETNYRRNKIRNQLIPLYKEISGGTHSLENAVKILNEEADFLDQTAQKYFEKIAENNSSLSAWQNVPQALTARVLSRFIHLEKNSYFIPTAATVERFINEVKSATHKENLLPLNDEMTLTVSKNGVKFAEHLSQPKEVTWNPVKETELNYGNQLFRSEIVDKMKKPCADVQYFDLEKLSLPLRVRPFQAGDKIKTFSGFTKKLKKIFSDKKVPKSERQNIAVLESAGEIIWATGLTRSNIAAVSGETRQILKLTFNRFN